MKDWQTYRDFQIFFQLKNGVNCVHGPVDHEFNVSAGPWTGTKFVVHGTMSVTSRCQIHVITC
jgi:hypothetical protein